MEGRYLLDQLLFFLLSFIEKIIEDRGVDEVRLFYNLVDGLHFAAKYLVLLLFRLLLFVVDSNDSAFLNEIKQLRKVTALLSNCKCTMVTSIYGWVTFF
jgi:hypothetical protein